MKKRPEVWCILLLAVTAAFPVLLFCQSGSAGSSQGVPRLVKFSGILKDASGTLLNGTVGVSFAVYSEPTGGVPQWEETQNVQFAQGRYIVLLGETHSDGIPAELFASGQSRWLGVRILQPGEEEQQRVFLTSVPYALKASDSDTLGGLPSSAFLRARETASAGSLAGPSSKSFLAPATGQSSLDVTTSGGSVGAIAKFTSSSDIENSSITDSNGIVSFVETEAHSGAETHSGATSLTGNVTATAGQNSVAVYSLNGIIYIDGNKYQATQTGLTSALTAAQAISGTVVIPSGTSISITSSLNIGSSSGGSSQPVALVLEAGASLKCNITNTTDCFLLTNKSAIIGRSLGILPVITCMGTIRSCITNADKTHNPGQEFFAVDGVNIASTLGSSVSTGLLDIEGVGVNSTVKDVVIAGCPSVCLNISIPPSGVGNTDMTFRNVWLNGESLTSSTKPLNIAATVTTALSGSINFYGGAIEHSGGTLPLVTITGTKQSFAGVNGYTLENVGFYGTAFELNTSSSADGIDIADATAHFSNCRFSGSSGSYADAIHLATGGNITVEHLWLDGINAGHTINDLAHGFSIANYAYVPFYSSPPDSYTQNLGAILPSLGGTCQMSNANVCLATVLSGFTACIATVQGSSPIVGACSISGTTLTVTAASPNSFTWGFAIVK